MPDSKPKPRFNLKAVIRQTGLKPDTLRAWERRYGLPVPARSEGGHRLYSQRDIDTVRWLMARQQEGLSISRAVEVWKGIEAEEHDPLATAPPLGPATRPIPKPEAGGESLTHLRQDWVASCLLYDERHSEQILTQAFAQYPPEVVALDLLQKAVAQIGEAWYLGDVTVQQEHFCSSLAIRHLEALVMAAPAPTRPGRIVVGCPPKENHVIPPLLLTLLLRRRGWEVVYLGANVPSDRLESTVDVVRPSLVILPAQRLQSAATLLDIAEVLQRIQVPLAYGGLVFNLIPNLRNRVPGHFLGEGLDQATEVVERLVTSPVPVRSQRPVDESSLLAREHFLAQQGLIEAQVARTANDLQFSGSRLTMINHELAEGIVAALTLGDMAYLGSDLDWVLGLLRNRDLPGQVLHSFLRAYIRAAEAHLDERGKPVLGWLDRVARNGVSLAPNAGL